MPTATLEDIRATAARVVDPEIPVLTIEDLGILRDVTLDNDAIVVRITPTYSGCPALGQIEDDILSAMEKAGHGEVRVELVHHPAWSTAWITPEGHRKLADFGIAPPTSVADVKCPRCEGAEPKLVAQFGSTACKALMVCSSCGDPFDYFKEH